MIEIDKHCTGCFACVNTCPKDAIKFATDRFGFSTPEIDKTKCINCGKCSQSCPKENFLKKEPIAGYWLKSKNKKVLLQSSSGGAFHYLAEQIIAEGGIVFGCVFDSQQRKFLCANSDDYTLEELQKSKYVESYIGDAYKKIEQFLRQDRKVLFCGTPCQCAGLSTYLRKDYEKLILLDFACGGVPSQKFFIDHLSELEKKYKSRVVSVDFRDKYYRWGQHCLTITFENGRVYRRIAEADPYFYSFLSKEIKRKSCRDCIFSESHSADIVLADYWKYKSFSKELHEDSEGLSLVVTQSEKGEQMMMSLSGTEEVEIGSIPIENATYNFVVRRASEKNDQEIDEIHSYIKSNGISAYYRKVVPLKNRLKYQIKQRIMSRNGW